MSNLMSIEVKNGRVLTESVVTGLDTSNLLASTLPYTATEDCFGIYKNPGGIWSSNDAGIAIDGVTVCLNWIGNSSSRMYANVLVKKGQKVTAVGSLAGQAQFSAYGIKR